MPKKRYPGNSKQVTIKDVSFIVWCDGRSYDPVLEIYRAVYSYSILTSHWRYDASDIQGSPNKPPNLSLACAAILGMFLTCITAEENSENAEMFPPHVKEAGENIIDELTDFCSQITE